MKPNRPHHWNIAVHGKPQPGKKRSETVDYIGTIEGALQAADELESEVEFEVVQFVITRLDAVKKAPRRQPVPAGHVLTLEPLRKGPACLGPEGGA